MKKGKILLSVMAIVLSAGILFGCAGAGLNAIGKKYDAVYAVYDNYVVAAKKGGAVLFKDGKQLNKDPYFSIEQFDDGVYDAFLVRKTPASPYEIFETGKKALTGFGDVTEIAWQGYTNAKANNGVGAPVTTGYILTFADGKKKLVSADLSHVSASYYESITKTGAQYFFKADVQAKNPDNGDQVETLSDVIAADGTKVISGKFGLTGSNYFPNSLLFDWGVSTVMYTDNSVNPAVTTLYVYDTNKVNLTAQVTESPTHYRNSGHLIYTPKDGKPTVYTAGGGTTALSDDYYGAVDTINDKLYVVEKNASNKIRIVEFGGAAVVDWHDSVETPSVAGRIYFKAVNDGKTTIYTDKVEKLFDNIGAGATVAVQGGSDGYEVFVTDGKKVTANLQGQIYEKTFADDDAIQPVENGVVTAVKDGKIKMWIPRTDKVVENITGVSYSAPTDDFILVTIGEGDSARYMIAATKNLRYWDGTLDKGIDDVSYNAFNSLGVPAADIATINIAAATSVNVVMPFAKGDYNAKKDAAKAKNDYTVRVPYVLITYTLKNGQSGTKRLIAYGAPSGFRKYKYIYAGDKKVTASSTANVLMVSTGSVGQDALTDYYKFSGTGDGVTATAIMTNVSGVSKLYADSLKNVYVAVFHSDYAAAAADRYANIALYDVDGKLVLDPKYSVRYLDGAPSVEGGNAFVVQGDKAGIVRLGKKSKLIKKIEYQADVSNILPGGSFALRKNNGKYTLFGVNGKAVAKNVTVADTYSYSDGYKSGSVYGVKASKRVIKHGCIIAGYSDGKQRLIELSTKEKDLDFSIAGLL
ncbi:MAG: hypothetical protein LBP26_02155 [Clostridiales bacterium]|nr:hypothetical protein [Clostridiales bacterium]